MFVISSLPSPKSSLVAEPSHTRVKMCVSGSCRLCPPEVLISVSPAPLKEFTTNWTSMVKETWMLFVYCTYKLLLPSYKLLVLCLLMTTMFTWTTKYQGLEQDYLNMMPLKHAIAFIYDDSFILLHLTFVWYSVAFYTNLETHHWLIIVFFVPVYRKCLFRLRFLGCKPAAFPLFCAIML